VTGTWLANVVTISGTPTAAGPFTYTVTLTGGCGAVTATGTITVNPVPTVAITNPAAVCSPLTVDLTAAAVTAGSSAGLTYTYWTDALATIAYATPAAAVAGTYYIKGSDPVTGCYDIKPVTVTVNPVPTVAVTNPAAICSPLTVDLTAAAVTSGSTAGLTYTYWTDALATIVYATPAAAVAGTYYIEGSDPVTGCYDIEPVTVTVNPVPTVTITNPAAVCLPLTVDLTAAAVTAGSSAGLTYTYWTDALATIVYATPAAAVAGMYYIKGSDPVTGCYDIKPVTVTSNTSPTVTTTQVNVACFGGTSGSATAIPAGGTGVYTYSWNTIPVQTSVTATGLAAGTYIVTVFDGSGCSATASTTITEPAAALSGAITLQSNVTIPGGNDGSVTVAGSGGTSPYQYKIGSGAYQVSGTFGTLMAGSYTITVQDINLCTFDVPVTITQPAATLSGSISSQTNVACFGTSTGSVTVIGSGGVAPYEYSLNAGTYQASGTFGSLAVGTYIITVRDAVLNTFDVSVIITQPASSLGGLRTSQTNVLCFGSNTASLTVTGSGGIVPYQYKMGTGSYQASGTFGTLTAGSYIVTVQDANLCTFDVVVIITQPLEALTGSITTQTNVSCNTSINGSVTIAGSGGIAPYSYSLNGGASQTSGIFNGLAAATYAITVTDANLCTTIVSATITEPEVLSISSTKTDASCPGVSDGSITLTITGGTQPYSVIWSDGILTKDRLTIPDGTYSVVVTDKNGCASSLDIVVGIVGSDQCLEIPDIITPNNDGFNDTWNIKNIDLFPNAEVFVFTRWGKLVFQSKNLAANPWNGTFKGKLLPTDSYHYILHLNDGSKPRSGVISIIRN
jgi:gliding motility-associated-like protein